MAKGKKAADALKEADKRHYNQVEKYVKVVDGLYTQAVGDLSALAVRIGLPEEDNTFEFPKSKQKEVMKVVKQLADRITATIMVGDRNEWNAACSKFDDFVETVLNTSKLSRKQLAKYEARNLEALSAFQQRKVEGLDLSERVWKTVQPFKDEVELAIDTATGEGKSAAELSRDVRSCLKDPDKLFRRVRDKYGNLHLSKAAKLYHPGQGVYRSSYKNAMRVTRTEINMAYRQSDHMRWQQLDFVVGIQVQTSNNHTCLGADGKPHRFTDICDELAGKYPKDFKFVGWHPQCRCFATPILKSLDEVEEEIDEDGNYRDLPSANEVKDVPDNFKQYIADNAARIEGWQSMPYYIKDNPQYIDEILHPEKMASKVAPAIDKQKANQADIESKLGIKRGEPMTFEQADELRANPHYVERSASGYTINCQSAVVANELRRRGYDVEAMMNTRQNANKSYQLSKATEMAWIDPATGKTPNVSKFTFYDARSDFWVFRDLERSYVRDHGIDAIINDPEDMKYLPNGRYHMRIRWKGDFFSEGGHIVTFEKTGVGQYRFLDAQTGSTTSLCKLLKYADAEIEYYRVDELMLNPDFAGVVAKAGTTKPSTVRYAKKKGGWSGAMDTDDELARRLTIHERADNSELADNIRGAKSLLKSFSNMTIQIREHVIKPNVSNPEYLLNDVMIADRKGIGSENGISSAFSKAIRQGCHAVVLDLDMHMGDKKYKTRKLASKIWNRRKDFEEGLIMECYVIYHDKAVCITNKMITSDKEKSIETIYKELEMIK